MDGGLKLFSIIVPVYNEEAVINESYARLTNVISSLNKPYELIFVNDGSKDKTAEIIGGIQKEDGNVTLVNFSRNFGHQAAITAGMDYARGDAMIIIDADLQDPPEVILDMIKLWGQGYDVVYGKRDKREGETFFKLLTAKIYYRLLSSLTDIEIPVDTGDFRLISRKVCDAMKNLPEKNRYVRGLVSWVGFKQVSLTYVREERFAGETKYPLRKMLKLAVDGVTSFSYKPLRLATMIGFSFSVFSFLYLLYVLYLKVFTTNTISGWASIIVILLFSQGIVLMILGLIGEYIGRIYEEAKNRPNYIVNEVIRKD
ncbi:MAG: glycosyltransferase family 2 protein [Clostridiales bacterium]|jgi:dolichol-phosphate mannosyltransferase|nr:glycosyltransferase family 2 protein [Clostridiales bacterium]